MTFAEAAFVWESRILGEIAAALIVALLVSAYVWMEWRASAPARAQRRGKR